MLIVEGPDGSGKTTLAKHIADALGYEYRRNPQVTSEVGSVSKAAYYWSIDQIDENPQKAVYDRFFLISEPIYQMVQWDKELFVSGKEIHQGILRLDNASPLLIFCLPPWDVSSGIVRGQPAKLRSVGEGMLRKVHWVYSAYAAMWANTLFERTRIFDFTKDKNEEVVEWITRSSL